jgi:hypothetical protein
MPALVAGIHVFAALQRNQGVDGRDKPGHDEFGERFSDMIAPVAGHGPGTISAGGCVLSATNSGAE